MNALKRFFFVFFVFFFCSIAIEASADRETNAKKKTASALDWQPDQQMFCLGSFKHGMIAKPKDLKPDMLRVMSPKTEVEGDKKQWCWKGKADIFYQDHQVEARQACYINPNQDSAAIVFNKPFRYQKNTLFLRAGKGALALHDKTLDAQNLAYHFDFKRRTLVNAKGDRATQSHTGWGSAKGLHGDHQGRYTIEDATFSTCPVSQTAWQIQAKKLHLYFAKGFAAFNHGTLRWHGVPVFYWPYLYFPIDQKARSGFLFPKISFNTSHQPGLQQPFYWRVAPNIDALLTPAYDGQRHAHVAQRWRYLGARSALNVSGDYWFHDPAFVDFKRDTLANATQLNGGQTRALQKSGGHRFWLHLNGMVDLADTLNVATHVRAVSDDYLIDDVRPPLDQYDSRHLDSDIALRYQKNNIKTRFWALRYHTLQPALQARAPNLYDRMPEWDADWSRDDWVWPGHWAAHWQSVRFVHGEATDLLGQFASGWRHVLSVDWSNTYDVHGWTFLPQINWIARDYRLDTGTLQKDQPLALPFLGLDMKRLWAYQSPNQSLYVFEPQVFFHFVPNWDNRQAPLFDTALFMPDYNQLFQMRRFDGWDRLGDDQSVGLGFMLSSVGPNGLTQWQLALGQKYAFKKHRVLIDDDGADDPLVSHHISDLDVDFDYFFNDHHDVHVNLAWDMGGRYWSHVFTSGNFNWSEHFNVMPYYVYARAMDRIIDADQISRTGKLNRAGLALDWVINARWKTRFDWSDNISQHRVHNFLASVFYDSCCWSLGFSAGRYWTGYDIYGKNLYDREYLVQFSLKGLGDMRHNWRRAES